LVDGNRDKLLAQRFDHRLVLERRRTVDDAIVSDAAQRVSGTHKHVDGFLLRRRKGSRLQN
jgi:hypothetical protein